MRTGNSVSRTQVLAFRRRTGLLDERLPFRVASLRRAAWVGLQDSAPRAALFSLHARVEGLPPSSDQHSSMVQLWGPRFHVYTVAADDAAVFTLGRMPVDPKGIARAEDLAERLRNFLAGRRMAFGQAGRGIGVAPNMLRYAAATGTIRLHWDGARQPLIWVVPAPTMTARDARVELAQRYLHVCGPTTAAAFGRWAGVPERLAHATFKAIEGRLLQVSTPLGESWILAEDEELLWKHAGPAAPVRLLPSGDALTLAWGADRELLVPQAARRAQLWTPRVWPGALLLNGEIAGVWRRAAATVSVTPWRRLCTAERQAVEAEVRSLSLPETHAEPTVRWS